MKILIIGIAGGLAQITARLIRQKYPLAQITGVDARDISEKDQLKNINYKKIKYSRGHFESLFRDECFDIVLHLGRMSHTSNAHDILEKRLNLSVMGTNRILDLSLKYNAKKLIILSTFHVYGAYADNPVFLREDHPLKASIKYPELRDVVEMDQICSSWMWKNKDKIDTIIFRPCNIIGPKINNTMTKFFTANRIISPIDFNPTFQFIHEFDMAKVIVESISDIPTGVYNVATNEFANLQECIKILKRPVAPIPIFFLEPLNLLLNKINLSVPGYLIDYLKFSCLLDNQNLIQVIGKDFFQFKLKETLELISVGK